MSQCILEVNTISKRFGGVKALDRVSIKLNEGEVLALAGDNGAGKSTLIKIISGVYTSDEGEISFNGRKILNNNPNYSRNLGIETIYQDLALADNLDVPSNIFLGREPIKKSLKFLHRLDRNFMYKQSVDVLESLKIEIPVSSLNQPVASLSGGQRQAIAISRAIYWNAKILIMDEPTAALGVPEQRKVLELIDTLKKSSIGIIFISHNLNDIFSASDSICVLRQGKKVCEKMISQTNKDEIVSYMVRGEA
jgi:simple sugar transport system ATP-binding protein